MLELRLELRPARDPEGGVRSPQTTPETVSLDDGTHVLGGDPECALVLSGDSVAARHAEVRAEDGAWWIADLGGGVELDGVAVLRARLQEGDRLRLGTVELVVERAESGTDTAQTPGEARDAEPGDSEPGETGASDTSDPGSRPKARSPESAVFLDPEAPLKHATLVRSLDDLDDKRQRLDQAYDNEIFRRLLDLAGTLVRATSVGEVAERVLAAAFDAFPVDRGFFFLTDDDGEPVCEVARIGDEVEMQPEAELPVSQTLLRTVMERRLAVVTGDARLDARLEGGKSLILHDIRSALCAPLRSGSGQGARASGSDPGSDPDPAPATDQMLGVLQLDTPSLAGVFRERDLDLLTAVADLAAGAVARIRLARLGRYHSPAVVEEVLRQRDVGGRGLREADVTVLFADLVGFTAFAESTAPDEVVELLAGFFDRAVDAVFSQGGTLDKFLGDGVLAFFGAPVAQEDHPERAVAAATRLQERLATWNRERRAEDRSALEVRMALESGPVLVGEIGSEPRMEYTVLGSTVNRAARLEQTVAEAGDIVLGPEIRKRLDHGFATEDLGEMQLRGLEGTVRVYRLPPGEPSEPE